MRDKIKCESCEGDYPEDEIIDVDSQRKVCETCFSEAESIATIVYSDESGEHSSEDGGTMDIITEYENNTDFKIEWKSTDAWRGYYEVIESGDWVNVHSDCILAMSEDERELKNFDEKLEESCKERGITIVKVFCRTSNLFSSGYDVFVKREHVSVVDYVIKALKGEYRDPVRFNETALTGKDPKDITQNDKDFVMGALLVKQGADPKDAIETVKRIRKIDKILKEGR